MENPYTKLNEILVFDHGNICGFSGINKLREWNPDIQIHFASDLIVHPNYNETTFSNDIGLVRLLRKAQFSKTIWPICLWDNGDDIAALYGKLGMLQ